MRAIYILSNGRTKRYKVGSHTGDIKALKYRYITAIPDVIIHQFIITPHAKEAERIIKEKLREKRVVNSNGNLSEWIKDSLKVIVGNVMSVISTLHTGTTIVEFRSEENTVRNVSGGERDKQSIQKDALRKILPAVLVKYTVNSNKCIKGAEFNRHIKYIAIKRMNITVSSTCIYKVMEELGWPANHESRREYVGLSWKD